jgi:3-deoxy-7-phosphoheptulonate synthase
MPIGYKNGTDGSLTIASNAMLAASQPHHFLGINYDGAASIVTTTGNPDGHMVLRGGSKGPNYDAAHVAHAAQQLAKLGLNPRVMIDCSHGNSNKDYRRQVDVLEEIANQLLAGSRHVMGVMIESHLVEGNQPIPADLSHLCYGQSITDPCVNFETTEKMLRNLARTLRGDRQAVH